MVCRQDAFAIMVSCTAVDVYLRTCGLWQYDATSFLGVHALSTCVIHTMPVTDAGENTPHSLSASCLCRPRLLATCGAWFLWDFSFYGNKVFQSTFIAVLSPSGAGQPFPPPYPWLVVPQD